MNAQTAGQRIPETLGDVDRLRDFLAAKQMVDGLRLDLEWWLRETKAR